MIAKNVIASYKKKYCYPNLEVYAQLNKYNGACSSILYLVG